MDRLNVGIPPKAEIPDTGVDGNAAAKPSTSRQQDDDDDTRCWVELTEGKTLARLLYTNPVSFLTASSPQNQNQKNVMVLSWLTATNNDGQFMFSLNKRRHTASILHEGALFTLSIPVQGMEELVRNVGSVSGRFGSKFPSDNIKHKASLSTKATGVEAPKSKRQKKKLLRQGEGVPQLESVPIVDNQHHQLFAIRGTVARMVCRVNRILEGAIDSEHLLVLAVTHRALVRTDYWDQEKVLFRPMLADTAPYLTFFGSQTFGYVVSEPNMPVPKASAKM